MPERFNPQLTQSDQALFITAMMCAPGGLVNVKVRIYLAMKILVADSNEVLAGRL